MEYMMLPIVKKKCNMLMLMEACFRDAETLQYDIAAYAAKKAEVK